MTVSIKTPRKDITFILSSHLHQNVKLWHRKVEGKPITYEEFSKWQIPKKDIPKIPYESPAIFPEGTKSEVLQTVKKMLGARDVTNSMMYNPMSGMYWHTNSDSLGTRIYYTFSLDKSVFKYKDPNTGDIHESWDKPGCWTVRSFDIFKEKPLWHCVWSAGRRFSFGFVI